MSGEQIKDKYDASQKAIIDRREGFVVADAGPGTGKTHTVVGRCIELLRDSIKDANFRAAMLTFTRNAAGEMQERLIGECSDLLAEKEIGEEEFKQLTRMVRQMFIGTFDSYCLNILKKSPWTVSEFFGFEEHLTSSASTSENNTLNLVFFKRFVDEWLEMYGVMPEYGEYPAIASEHVGDLFDLINRLMSMGIVPMRHGWFGGTPRARADETGPVNEPVELRGNPEKVMVNISEWCRAQGNKIADKFDMARCYDSAVTDAFDPSTVTDEQIHDAAYDNRDALLLMIHDIYFEYIRKCVATDHLTFGLTACFAYIALYESEELRTSNAVDQLIVDEFQDTNTLQLMISMMVLRKPNMCVVGDWRQGIYGFRYVSVDNILHFHARLKNLHRFLNDDKTRVPYSIPDESEVASLPLAQSYRSSQRVVDIAYRALTIPATENEIINDDWSEKIISERISSVNDDKLGDKTWVIKVKCDDREDETEEVARRIVDFVEQGTPVYDKHKNDFRPARFGDVSVLCKRSEDCREVYEMLRGHRIPVFLQGDMEIMNTPEGKIMLAWLKYVENESDSRGYVPIVSYLGYSPNEIVKMNDDPGLIPEPVRRQRQQLLRKRRRVTDFAATVFRFHNLNNDISQAITDVLSSAHNGSLMTVSEMINMIETDIENETKYNVDGQPEKDAVTVQTMHKSKGLEYPFVILPYMDVHIFPQTPREKGTFTFTDVSGIRCRFTKVTMDNGESEIDGSWKTRLVMKSEPKDYDEQRRLLFVAISRAKQYVMMTAGDNPSAFFKNILDGDGEPSRKEEVPMGPTRTDEVLSAPSVDYDTRSRPVSLSVHDIMGHGGVDVIRRPTGKTKGMNYGTRVHKMAEMMVYGTEIGAAAKKEFPEVSRIEEFLNGLPEGERFAETRCNLLLDVDGRDVLLNGEIDLMVVGEEVHIYDWKTDADDDYMEDYRVQLSVYANCAARQFKGKNVSASIVWLSLDNLEEQPVDILTEMDLVDIVRKRV